MADFFDDEAEVGTTDEEDEVEDSSKLKKKPKRAISSDEDEDDEDDEEKARDEMRDFIAVRMSLSYMEKRYHRGYFFLLRQKCFRGQPLPPRVVFTHERSEGW